MSISIKKIQSEASQKIAYNRFQAVFIYGSIYTLFLNFFVIANSFDYMWIYAIVLTLCLICLIGPISFSMTDFYLLSYRLKTVQIFKTVEGFKRINAQRALGLHLLRLLLVLVFSLLLIVPGVMYAHRTSMAMYLLRANPKMSPKKALQGSAKIMKGNYKAFFFLNCRYIVWFIICILTLGVGFMLVLPNYYMAKLVFYKRVLQGDTKTYDPEEVAARKQIESEIMQIERLEKMAAFKKVTTPQHREITFSPQMENSAVDGNEAFDGQLDFANAQDGMDFESQENEQQEVFIDVDSQSEPNQPDDNEDDDNLDDDNFDEATQEQEQEQEVQEEIKVDLEIESIEQQEVIDEQPDDVAETELDIPARIEDEVVVKPIEILGEVIKDIEPEVSVHEVEEQVVDFVEINHDLLHKTETVQEDKAEPLSEEEHIKRLQEEARAKLEAMRREKEEKREREIQEKKQMAMQRVAELRAKAASRNKSEKDENE